MSIYKIWYFISYSLSHSTRSLLFICLLFGTKEAFAISDFYKNKAEGWFWYKDPVKEKYEDEKKARMQEKQTKLKKKEIKGSEMQVPKNLTPESAKAFKEEFQKKLDDAKNMWLFSADVKYAAEYLRMQKRILDFANRSTEIAATAKRIYPDLNDEILNPTSQTARTLFEEQKKELEDKMITEYAKEFHLVYFTDPRSQACQIFAKTLAEFSALYGFKVFAQEVVDKTIAPKILQSKQNNKGDKLFEIINDQALLASVAPKHLPALVAIDPETRQWQPIAYHMPNFYELRRLVLETIKDIISKMNSSINQTNLGSHNN
jgi:conjugal transfer pilus assembly protein TraF